MIVRALDVNHDFTFGKGKSNYKKDTDAIMQTIQTRLMSFLGDCFFDTEAGIDWFNLLGSKDINRLLLKVRTMILETEGVQSLIDLGHAIDENRNISITYTVTTIYSTQATGSVTNA